MNIDPQKSPQMKTFHLILQSHTCKFLCPKDSTHFSVENGPYQKIKDIYPKMSTTRETVSGTRFGYTKGDEKPLHFEVEA